MRLRTVTGKSISEALDRVQRELGPNALVLETRTEGENTEVIAAEVEREEPTEGLMRLRAEVALLRRELSSAYGGLRGATPAPAPTAMPAQKPAAAAPVQAPRPIAGTAVVLAQEAAPTRTALVERRLNEQGVEPRLVKRVVEMLAHAPIGEGSPLNPLRGDFVLNAVSGLLPGVAANDNRAARCFVFVGPGSSGKSTTISKLAVQVGQSGGTSFGLMTLDTDGPAGTDMLGRTAERLGVPYVRVRGASDMADALDELGHLRMLLVDTGSLSAREERAIAALHERMHQPGQIACHLVLPANLEPYSMRATAESFRPMAPSAIVFTKLDETRRFGELINLPAALEVPVSALGHGRVVDGDLAPATRRLVAQVVLGRRTLASSLGRP